MTTKTARPGDARGPVQIEQYDPGDRADVLALDETVWDRTMSESWFAWKYEENPYVTEPPVFVARADGQVVGARPFMAFLLRVGDDIVCALQPSDTMVHPRYRGIGIFTRMTENAISYYAVREPKLCFNFPNEMAWPGYRKLGWRAVSERTTYYRVQNPTVLSSEKLNGRFVRLVSRVASPAARTLLAFLTRSDPSPDRFTVERETGVPMEQLTALYRRRVPRQIHAYRDEAFYRWRFASPVWRRRTYIARENGTRVAGIVARTRTTADGITVTQLADVVPLCGDDRWSAALARLLDSVVADHSHSDLLAAQALPLPDDLLTAYGFLPDDRLPLSWCTEHRRTFVVRPLGELDEAAWDVNGYRLTDSSNWLLSFSERDTA